MLDTIWAQQPGQEVVFEWVQWLQSSMLSHLGFDGRIIIRQSDRMMGHVDVRAVGDILSVEEIVEHLISYNEEQCHETFLRGIHVCTICLHEYTGNLDVPFDAAVLSLVLIFAPCYALDYL
jgi:E3 ubiquitin-protein ligase RNF14